MPIFPFTVDYQQVLTLNCPRNKKKTIKDMINVKKNNSKCFLWCHIRHLKPLKTHLKRITKADKKRLMILILNFLLLKKITARLNKRMIFASMYFVMEIV